MDHLPAESATRTALRDAMTPEQRAEAAKRESTGHGPWSLTDQLLAGIYDGIAWLQWAKTDTSKSKPPPPLRRPGVEPVLATVTPISAEADEYLENIRRRHREGA